MRARRRAFPGTIGFLFLVWLVVARSATAAAPARVALVHEAEPGPLEQRALTRLRAELIAAGFEITEVERNAQDAREPAEVEAGTAGVFATIAIVPRTADAADIWMADRITGKAVVRRIQAPGNKGQDAANVLAVRAVELLQASLLEALDPASHDGAEPTKAPSSSAPAAPGDGATQVQAQRPESSGPSRHARFALQAGAGVIHSFGGIGPAFLPVLGFAYRLNADLGVGLRAGGPAFAADLRAPQGTIAVHQELAMLELSYELLARDAAARPVVVAGVGVYHLDIAGAAAPPFQGNSNGVFGGVVTAGPGARLRLGERVSVLGDLRLLFVAPKPVVRSVGAEAGSMSRPSLYGEIAVDVAF